MKLPSYFRLLFLAITSFPQFVIVSAGGCMNIHNCPDHCDGECPNYQSWARKLTKKEAPSKDDDNGRSLISPTGSILQLDRLRRLDSIDLDQYKENCGTLDFDVDLILLKHLYLLIEPTTASQAQGSCEAFLLHATSGDNDVQHKEAVALEGGLAALDAEGFASSHGVLLSFGTYKLNQILQAYENAPVDSPGHSGESYDFIYNNCGDMIAEFMYQLGYVTTGTETKIIAEVLYQLMPRMATGIREELTKKNMVSLMDATDEELMVWLVEMRTKKMYANQQEKVNTLRDDVDELKEEVEELKEEVEDLKEGAGV